MYECPPPTLVTTRLSAGERCLSAAAGGTQQRRCWCGPAPGRSTPFLPRHCHPHKHTHHRSQTQTIAPSCVCLPSPQSSFTSNKHALSCWFVITITLACFSILFHALPPTTNTHTHTHTLMHSVTLSDHLTVQTEGLTYCASEISL